MKKNERHFVVYMHTFLMERERESKSFCLILIPFNNIIIIVYLKIKLQSKPFISSTSKICI